MVGGAADPNHCFRKDSVSLCEPLQGVCFILKDSSDMLFLDSQLLSQPYNLNYFINTNT